MCTCSIAGYSTPVALVALHFTLTQPGIPPQTHLTPTLNPVSLTPSDERLVEGIDYAAMGPMKKPGTRNGLYNRRRDVEPLRCSVFGGGHVTQGGAPQPRRGAYPGLCCSSPSGKQVDWRLWIGDWRLGIDDWGLGAAGEETPSSGRRMPYVGGKIIGSPMSPRTWATLPTSPARGGWATNVEAPAGSRVRPRRPGRWATIRWSACRLLRGPAPPRHPCLADPGPSPATAGAGDGRESAGSPRSR